LYHWKYREGVDTRELIGMEFSDGKGTFLSFGERHGLVVHDQSLMIKL